MKLPPFDYHRADSADEAVALLAEFGDEAKVLAGGQSLVPVLSLRLAHPAHIVDINRVDGLATVSNGSDLTLGALVRHRVLERSEVVRSAGPLLAEAARFIGHTAIRTRGSIGGSMAHADPTAELPAVLTVLDGVVEARGPHGTREIAAADFFAGSFTTSLEPDELLTAVRIPRLPRGSGCSFQEFTRRGADFAIVGVAAVVRLDSGGTVAEARLAFSGVDSRPVRPAAAESLMTGAAPSDGLWESAAREAAAVLEPPSDLHGSAPYRRHLAAVLAERALNEACRRARED